MSPGATHATIGSKKRYIKPARPSNGSHQLSQDLDVITQKNTKKTNTQKIPPGRTKVLPPLVFSYPNEGRQYHTPLAISPVF